MTSQVSWLGACMTCSFLFALACARIDNLAGSHLSFGFANKYFLDWPKFPLAHEHLVEFSLDLCLWTSSTASIFIPVKIDRINQDN